LEEWIDMGEPVGGDTEECRLATDLENYPQAAFFSRKFITESPITDH